MKKKQLYILLVCNIILGCGTGRVSQNLDVTITDSYKVINAHFKNESEIKLAKMTTNTFKNEVRLNSLAEWNKANHHLSNINRETRDFNKLFYEEEFESHIDSFISMDRTQLSSRLVANNISLKKNSNRKISFPYIFLSSMDNKRYALIYSETILGSEDASGEVFLYQKNDNSWNLIFVFSLWVS